MARNDIAIVGMGSLIPGALGTDQLWSSVLEGKSHFSGVPDKLWRFDSFTSPDKKNPNKSYTRIGGFLPDFEFPFLEYRLPPKTLEGSDRAQLVALEAARQALKDAGIELDDPILNRGITVIGVIGVDSYAHASAYVRRHDFVHDLADRLRERGVKDSTIESLKTQFGEQLREWGHYLDPTFGATGNIESAVSNRVAQVFGVRGFNMTVDAACAGGLVSMEMGCHALIAGDADVALVGGVDLGTGPAIYVGFARVGGLSTKGVANPFDASADGLVIGEGGGMVVLKRLEDALEAGDRIHAVIRGSGSSSDGAGTAIYTPSKEGRKEAMVAALDDSLTAPEEIQYMECHATSTVVGDANEYDAIGEVFGGVRGDRPPMKLGSIKYQIGHLKGAAGVVGVIKTIKAMEAETYPHMPMFKELTHEATYRGNDLEIPTVPTPWPLNEQGKRVAAVTASGFGGINYQIILERCREYTAPVRTKTDTRRVAIIGVACRVPGAATSAEFWENVRNGKDLFTEVDPVACKWQHLTDTIDTTQIAPLDEWTFNSPKFRIFPNAVSQIAPTQFLALDLTDRLLKSTGYAGKGPKNISACIGAIHNDHFGDIFEPMMCDEYVAAIRECAVLSAIDGAKLDAALSESASWLIDTRPPVTEHTLPGWMGNCISGRMSKAFDLHGPNFVVDTACSSSLAAMMAGVYQVMFGRSEACISGGLNLCINPELAFGESSIGATAKHTARPFDKDSDGFLQGEGGIFFLFKDHAAAKRDGDEILAVIRGVGGSSEADSRSMIAPSERAVRRAMRRAMEQAKLPPNSISVVDTHGSGNRLADIIEARSIAAELRDENATDQVSITAVKSHVGHLFGAAGASGLLSVIGSLRYGEAPAIRNLQTVRDEVNQLSAKVKPLRKNTALPERPQAGGVNSLGLGGANYFLVVEVPNERSNPIPSGGTNPPSTTQEKRPIMPRQPQLGTRDTGRREAPAAGGVFLAAAASEIDLSELIASTLGTSTLPESIGDLTAPLRLAVSFDSPEVLREKLELTHGQLSKGLNLALLEARGIFAHDTRTPTGKLAFCFSGQGNQYIGMARNLFIRDATFKAIFETLDALARDLLGFSIIESLYSDTAVESGLGGLEGSQATIFAVEIGLARVLERMGVKADILIGHSFGEFAALAFADVWSLEDAFRAVVARIQATQSVVKSAPLGMMTLNTSVEVRNGLLGMVGDKIVLCNVNAPGRFVLGGEKAAIEKAFAMAEAGGIDATILPIAAAFHTPFMESGKAALQRDISRLSAKAPRIPILSTVDGHLIESRGFRAKDLHDRLARQLVTPLNFPKHVHTLVEEHGVREFLEVGPKWSVTKMIQAILGTGRDPDALQYRATPTLHPKVGDEETFRRAQAVLVALGRLDLRASEAHREHGIVAEFHAYLLEYEPELLPVLDAAFARFARRRPRHHEDIDVSKAPPVRSASPSPTPVAAAPVAPLAVVPPARSGTSASAQGGNASFAQWEDRVRAKLVDKTGYPAEMLESELDLEADLGIDSVQRAEIWAILLEENSLPEDLQPKGARTIRELAGFLHEASPEPGSAIADEPSEPAEPAELATQPGSISIGGSLEVWETRLRDKLVEKTGYPAEMLEPELDLEADLGIDSVQRAEIWAILLEEHGMPEDLEPKGARTIRELAQCLAGAGPQTPPPVPSPEPTKPKAGMSEPAAQDSSENTRGALDAGPAGQWEDRLRAKLVEKTGYPAEMLESGLDLEADLGIDSVQRAEIWAILVEEHGLPEDLQPKGARTIADLAGFLAQGASGQTAGASSSALESESTAARQASDISDETDVEAPQDCGLYVVTSTLPTAAATAAFQCGRVLLIGGRDCRDLRKSLESRGGVTVEVVSPDKLIKADAPTTQRWVEACDTLIYVAHATLIQSDLQRRSTKHLRDATVELFECFRALVPALESTPRRVLFPTSQDGAFGASNGPTGRPFGGFPAGFVRSLQRELSDCNFQLLDANGSSWETVINNRLNVVSTTLETGPEQTSPIPAMTPATTDDNRYPVGKGDLVYVTGGARGIVFECAFGLAKATGCRLFLTGRTPEINGSPAWLTTPPDRIDDIVRDLEIGWVRNEKLGMREAKQRGRMARAQWEIARNQRRLANAGLEGSYNTCDVTDTKSLAASIDQAAKNGPIRGVIHGAGVQKSLRLVEVDNEQLLSTFDTKLVPVLTFLEKLDWNETRFILGFGSVAGLFGNAGQTHYALANDLMTGLLRHAKEIHPHLQSQTIHWTAWKGTGMVTAAQAERFAAGGLTLLGIDEGVNKFLTALSGGREHRELAVYNASSELSASRPQVATLRRSNLVSPQNGVPTRRARFSLTHDLYLRQHLVAGNPVVPGTFIAEMMAEISGSDIRELRDVTFRRPLWVRDEGFEIELVADDNRIAVLPLRRRDLPKSALANLEFANCTVPSEAETDSIPGSWATAKLDERVIRALREGMKGAQPEFYKIIDERFRQVLNTGNIFRGVASMTEDDGVFYGLTRLTDEAMRSFEVSGGFRFNPVVADMAVQVAAAHGVLNRGVLAIPHSIARLHIGAAMDGREAIVRCEPKAIEDDGARLDVSVHDLTGNLLLGFEGLTLKSLPSEV